MAGTDELDMVLLTAIRDVRMAKGACTVRDLAAAMNLTVGGVQHRLAKAEAAGTVEHTGASGSIRVAMQAGEAWSIDLNGHRVEAVLVDGVPLEARVAS